MIIWLGDFNDKVSNKHTFKPIIWNKRLHEIKNGNGFRAINIATSKNITVKRTTEQR
jgi:hypothetical protein